MTLRARLAIAFLALVLVPLLVGAALLVNTVTDVNHRHSVDLLRASRHTATLALSDLCRLAHSGSEALANRAQQIPPAEAVTETVNRNLGDLAAVQAVDGSVTASAGVPASEVPRVAGAGSCNSETRGNSSAVVSSVVMVDQKKRFVGTAWTGFVVDRGLASRLSETTGAQVTVFHDGKVVASSLPPSGALRLAAEGRTLGPGVVNRDHELVAAVTPTTGQPLSLVISMSTPSPVGYYLLIGFVLFLAVGLGIIVALRLARAVTAPLAVVGEAAERVAAGDLETRVPVRRRDEVGRLAESFNMMTHELAGYVGALRAGRDQLRRNLDLLGDTLSSTLDLGRILTVVLDTAMAATGARSGAVFLSQGGGMRCEASSGFSPEVTQQLRSADARSGAGVVATVARSGEPMRGCNGPEATSALGNLPDGTVWLAVPLISSGRVVGVMCLCDRLGGDEFDDSDTSSMRGFANHAAVAIDNVLLHQETQQLAVVDPLTGLANYRYFQTSTNREIERAHRFTRPLALLMLDVDHFREINDAHGHAAGDAVLVELAQRLDAEVREVDILARYGGEELVLVLPETDAAAGVQAATRLCELVRSAPVRLPNGIAINVTVSIGGAVYPEHGATVRALVDRADDALYAAKSAGRDRCRIAGPDAPADLRPADL